MIPYNPLAGGLLTGKHDRKAPPPEGSRFQLGTAGARYQARYWHDREFETIDALRQVAKEAGMSMATLAMRWVLSNPAITAPIVGASRPEQLADSLAAAEKGALPGDLKKRARRDQPRLAGGRCRTLAWAAGSPEREAKAHGAAFLRFAPAGLDAHPGRRRARHAVGRDDGRGMRRHRA